MQDLGQGNYNIYEWARTSRENGWRSFYVCYSLDGKRKLFISRSCFYSRVIVYFCPGLFKVAANSTRCDTWSDKNTHLYIVSNR